MGKEREFDNFNKYVDNYHDVCNNAVSVSGADSTYFHENKVLELLKYENRNEPLKILDFGCGDGLGTSFLSRYFSNAKINGVDVSEKSIDIANQKSLNNCSFNAFDGKKLPYENEEFDLVFASMVFHHIEFKHHEEILNEISRVLKKGGRFYNFEHNPNNPLTRKVVRECPFDEDAVLLKPKYHRNLIDKSNLSLEKLTYTLFFPRHKLFKPFLGMEKLLSWCPIGAQYYIKAIK